MVGGLTSLVLVLTVYDQLHDTNFYSLFEATALLAGDHPYRDFFEWGMPLQVVMSAGAQWLAGNRLIAEFLLQWSGIVIGAMIAFRIALELSQSVRAAIVTVPFTLTILAATPTFHYPKLLLYPVAVWFAWRYLEQPGVRRGVALGLVTAVAFLFRHDHGLYIGGLSVLTFGVARAAVPASRNASAMIRECVAYAAAVMAVITPWLIIVERSEGIAEYVRARAFLYGAWSAQSSPYTSLLHLNPVRALSPEVPPIKPATIRFTWIDRDAARRNELERQLALGRREGPDEHGRYRYEVQNPYDPALLKLETLVTDSDGLDWSLLRRLRWHIPSHNQGQLWIMQVALLIPLLVLASLGVDALSRRARGMTIPADHYRALLVAAFLAVIDARLFREPGYVVTVAPLTAALAARLLTSARRGAPGLPFGRAMVWPVTRGIVAVALLVVTAFAAVAFATESGIFAPLTLARNVRPAFHQLLVSPPIDGYQPADQARQYTTQQWAAADIDEKIAVMIRYMHDCTRDGDRVLVTGSTPYQVGYFVDRPIGRRGAVARAPRKTIGPVRLLDPRPGAGRLQEIPTDSRLSDRALRRARRQPGTSAHRHAAHSQRHVRRARVSLLQLARSTRRSSRQPRDVEAGQHMQPAAENETHRQRVDAEAADSPDRAREPQRVDRFRPLPRAPIVVRQRHAMPFIADNIHEAKNRSG
jgi:hypothetical protein